MKAKASAIVPLQTYDNKLGQPTLLSVLKTTKERLPFQGQIADAPKKSSKVGQALAELEKKGITARDLETNKDSLFKIKTHLESNIFEFKQDVINLSGAQPLTEFMYIWGTTYHKWQYKDIIRIIFKQKFVKFTAEELADGAVIMHTLIKIEQICQKDPASILHALNNIIKTECKIETGHYLEDNCKIITQYFEDNNGSLNLMKSLYANLKLENPFQSIDVNNEPSPPQGFFTSLRHAILHKFELAKEKIWGKAKITNSTNKIPEKDFENPHKDGQDHSKSYFETIFTPIKDTCVWIFTLGGLFSTHETDSNITTADPPP